MELILSHHLRDCTSDSCTLTGVDFRYCRIMASSPTLFRLGHPCTLLTVGQVGNQVGVKARCGESGGPCECIGQCGLLLLPQVDYPQPIMDKLSIYQPLCSYHTQKISRNFCQNSCLCWRCEHSYWHSGMRAREWGHGNSVWIASSLCHPNVFIPNRRLRACLCHRQIPPFT